MIGEDATAGRDASTHNDWREDTRRKLEQEADRLLTELVDGTRPYTERQLARKIRLEESRLPETDETAVPQVVVDYLLKRQAELLASSARLSRLQAAALALALQGLSARQIAVRIRIPYGMVRRALRAARRRIASRPSPYDGLYEVYWSEVNRYIYRKPKKTV